MRPLIVPDIGWLPGGAAAAMAQNAQTVAALTELDLDEAAYPGTRGTAAATTAASITLDGDAEATANYYVGAYIAITAGTGAGQSRLITAYTAAKVATIGPEPWGGPVPDGTSVYVVYGISGIAVAGTANSITLDANASAIDGIFTHSIIRINAGTGAGQVSRIKWYYTTRVAVVQDPWATVPDNTSVYSVFGEFGVSSSMTANTLTLSADCVNSAQGNYVGCYIELISVDDSNLKDIEVVGQVRKVVSNDASGLIMTVDKPWDKLSTAGEIVGYSIFGGWGGEAVSVGGATFSHVHTAVEPGYYTGVISRWSSPSRTGYTPSNWIAYHVGLSLYGHRSDDLDHPGATMSTEPLANQFFKIRLVAFGQLRGSVRTRLSTSAGGGVVPQVKTALGGAAVVLGETVSPDYRIQVARGKIPGASAVHLHAHVPSAAVGQLVGVETSGAQYPYRAASGAGVQLTLVSLDADDDVGLTGATEVTIEGVNNLFQPISEAIAMDGTTNVTTTATNWLGINSMVVTAAGTDTVNQGKITAVNGADVYGEIPAGRGAMSRLQYYAPVGQQLVIERLRLSLAVSSGGGAPEVGFSLVKNEGGVKTVLFSDVLETASVVQKVVGFDVPIAVGPSAQVALVVDTLAGGGAGVYTILGHLDGVVYLA